MPEEVLALIALHLGKMAVMVAMVELVLGERMEAKAVLVGPAVVVQVVVVSVVPPLRGIMVLQVGILEPVWALVVPQDFRLMHLKSILQLCW